MDNNNLSLIVDYLLNKKDLNEILDIPTISSSRKYWLIRSNSGEFWGDFKENSFVAFGHNNYTYEFIKNAIVSGKEDELKEKIRKEEKTSRPGLIINQTLAFYDKININDVVLTPSEDSSIISFGIVESKAYESEVHEDDLLVGECPYFKRRDVRWVLDVPSEKLDPYLFKRFSSHQAIANINDYSSFIDRTMYPIFIKNDEAHLRVDVNTRKKIEPESIIALYSLCSNESIKYDSSNPMSTKIAVQSPGSAEFISSFDNIIILATGLYILSKSVYNIIKNVNCSIKEGISTFQEKENLTKLKLENEKLKNEEKRAEQEHAINLLKSIPELNKLGYDVDNLKYSALEKLELSSPNIESFIKSDLNKEEKE